MRIKELKLIPPSKQSTEVLIEFIKEHEKGLKAIKTLAEIKEFCIDHTQLIHDAYPYLNIILDKINEVEDDKSNN